MSKRARDTELVTLREQPPQKKARKCRGKHSVDGDRDRWTVIGEKYGVLTCGDMARLVDLLNDEFGAGYQWGITPRAEGGVGMITWPGQAPEAPETASTTEKETARIKREKFARFRAYGASKHVAVACVGADAMIVPAAWRGTESHRVLYWPSLLGREGWEEKLADGFPRKYATLRLHIQMDAYHGNAWTAAERAGLCNVLRREEWKLSKIDWRTEALLVD
jgi:hypothetical protein